MLFHWAAKVCDRDSNGYRIRSPNFLGYVYSQSCVQIYCIYSRSQWEDEGFATRSIKDLKTEQRIYYQVLVDDRDYPYIVSNGQTFN